MSNLCHPYSEKTCTSSSKNKRHYFEIPSYKKLIDMCILITFSNTNITYTSLLLTQFMLFNCCVFALHFTSQIKDVHFVLLSFWTQICMEHLCAKNAWLNYLLVLFNKKKNSHCINFFHLKVKMYTSKINLL